MSHIRVNIKHRVQNAAIRSEVRNGRDVMIIPSAVAKFNTTLNNIHYPEDELRKSYLGINDTTAPLGHPVINNQHVSARTPGAINQFHIGAHNENARIEGDRIIADMVLDVDYAKRHPDGQRFLDAINAGKPISTSTGLTMEREDAPEGTEYKYIGRNYAWDHVAALLDEAPAIGTESGIGLMVNAAGEQEQVEVVNSELVLNDTLPGSFEDMRRALSEAAEAKYGKGFIDDFNADSVIFYEMNGKTYKIGYGVVDGAIVLSDERQEVQRRTTWEAVSNAVRSTLSKMFGTSPGENKQAHGLSTNADESQNHEEHEMKPEEIQAMLDKQAETMKAAFNSKLEETVKPLQDQVTAMNAANAAAEKKEKDTLIATVVAANALTQEEAQEMPLKALQAIERNCKGAAPLAPGLHANRSTETLYEAPEA